MLSDAGSDSCIQRSCNASVFVTNCSATYIKGLRDSLNVNETFPCMSECIVYGSMQLYVSNIIVYIRKIGRRLDIYLNVFHASTKLKLNESTKRNAWMSLRDTSPWRAANREECDDV